MLDLNPLPFTCNYVHPLKRRGDFYCLFNTVKNMTDARMLINFKIKESDKLALILCGYELNLVFIK